MTEFEKEFTVLDHGYMRLIEHWGSDERIVEAARMSTGKGFLGWGPYHSNGCNVKMAGAPKLYPADCCTDKPGDEKLLEYLYKNVHNTPFEMAGLVIEVQAPIFVFRQWQRHRTQSYNEMSARYVPLPDVNYLPSVERLMMVGGKNRQAGAVPGADELTEEGAHTFRTALQYSYQAQEATYQLALKAGVPKELARIHLPVARYSRMRASANLRNWLAFLTLRSDFSPSGGHAEWEIRQYANLVGICIRDSFPKTWELFTGWMK